MSSRSVLNTCNRIIQFFLCSWSLPIRQILFIFICKKKNNFTNKQQQQQKQKQQQKHENRTIFGNIKAHVWYHSIIVLSIRTNNCIVWWLFSRFLKKTADDGCHFDDKSKVKRGTLLHKMLQENRCLNYMFKNFLFIISRLGLDYVDLYLIHSPYGGDNVATYKQMMEFQKQGLIK